MRYFDGQESPESPFGAISSSFEQFSEQADQVGACTVFNIMGNNYRLITRIDYGVQTFTVKYFLTHAQYDRDKWKKDR